MPNEEELRGRRSQGARDALVHEFQAAVRASIEPVIRPAGFEWNASGLGHNRDEDQLSALFEAEPQAFARSFPSLTPDYGERWPPPCIDLWIRFYVGRRTIEADVEGTDLARWLREHGHLALADALGAPSDLQVAVRSLSEGLRTILFGSRSPSPDG